MSLSLAPPAGSLLVAPPPQDQGLSLGHREALPGGEAGTARDLAALVHHCTASDSRRDVVWLRLSTLPAGRGTGSRHFLLRNQALRSGAAGSCAG